jgi:hypothetical protein
VSAVARSSDRLEVAIVGYSNEPPLQAAYAALGATIVLAAPRWAVVDGSPGPFGAIRPPLS